MKNIRLFSMILLLAAFTACSEDALEKSPTTAVSGTSMFDNATAALVPLNGIYCAMHKTGWTTTGDRPHNWSVRADMLAADLMGEDMVIFTRSSGYFWRDHSYTMKERWTNTGSRSYVVWYGYYTYIANANYIIAAENTISGNEADVNYVVGQAYAIRAYSYFQLARWFSRTYKGHESDACVPIYTDPSVAGTQGKARSSVQEVYDLIVKDLDKAIELLDPSHCYAHTHISHLDYYSVNGLRAQVALEMNDWAKAQSCAHIARSNTKVGEGTDLTDGMNKTTYKNVMWGMINTIDVIHYQRMLAAHMDQGHGYTTAYGARDPKYTTPWLYNKMGANDIRRAWWTPVKQSRVTDGGYGYWQDKFRYIDPATYTGDYIFMRHEEMLLIEAEALCRQKKDSEARAVLMELMSKRDPDYTCTKSGDALGAMTNQLTGSLLEEILIQKRIELWAEGQRIFEIKRLKQGFERTSDQGFESRTISSVIVMNLSNPESWAWVLPIPQTEFDGNTSLDLEKDQNPLGDGL